MATTAVRLTVDGEHTIQSLQEALCKVGGTEPEIILDFSPVRQIGPNELTVLGDIAAAADRKTIKVTLQHVRVDIYKVLKLLKLSSRFSFES